jgi:hypothetical protein
MTIEAKRLIPALLVIAVLLAACGSPASEGGGSDAAGGGSSGDSGDGAAGITCPSPDAGASPDCPVSSTDDPTIVDPGQNSKARPVEITPGLLNPNMTAFDKHRVVDGDKLKLFFWGGVEDCYGVDHVDIEYGTDVIIATIFYGNKPGDLVCIEIAEYQAVRVHLDEPLEGRKVVDGAL